MKLALTSLPLALVFLLIASASESLAQTVNVPPAARQAPGQVQQWNQKPTSTHTQEKPDATPPPEPVIEGETPPEPVAPEMTQTFQVNTITVQGAVHLSQGEIDGIVKPYEGRELSFTHLRDISKQLTDLYHQKGYMTSMVYVPPQRIEGGQVLLQAAEGVLGDVSYEAQKYWPERAVLPRISFESGDLFNAPTLKRELRRINLNPDFKVRAILEPGDNPNETDLTLESSRSNFPVHVTPFFDNLGRDVIGRNRLGVTTNHNNVLGYGDQFFNSVAWTKRSFSTVSQYEVPIGSHGTRVGFNHAFSTLRVGGDFASLNLTGRSHIYSGYVSQEVVNKDNLRGWVDLGFDFKRVNTELSDTPFTEDKLRVLRPAINLDSYDSHGRTMMRHEFGIGLDLFGATTGNETGTNAASRVGAGSKFFRYTGSVTRIQNLPWNSYGIFRAMGQASTDRLVSIEQFQVGGAFTVRGYKEGRVIGDSGYVLSGEWRVPFYLFPASWTIPKTNYALRDNIQFVTFGDFGAVYTNDAQPGVDRNDYMLGVGAGVRANLTRFLSARVDLGVPLLRQAPDNQNPRLHFGLESRLF